MIVFTKEESIRNKAIYYKHCFICNREYWSTARNSKYCCEECQQKALIKVNKRNKTRRAKRKQYDENREINRALSKTYALAHDICSLYKIPEECMCSVYGYEDECSGEIELHHKDGNPFNNSPWNLVNLCRHHHGMADDEHANVNMVDTYNESLSEAGFDEESEKHITMINYTRNKILS